MYVATRLFFTKGIGQHREKLVSFEMALRHAKIASFNLVRVSSILPPHCKIITCAKGLEDLSPGQVVHAVIAEASTNEQHRLVAASVGVSIPKDRSQFGYLSEHHSFGMDDKTAGDYSEDLAAQMLATILGVDYDTNLTYNERKDLWKLNDQIIQTRNITQGGVGKRDRWTTVISAAVLLP
jgi:arginine decarboxylase